MMHEYDFDTGNEKDDTKIANADNPVEVRAVRNENRARKIEHLKKRLTYGGYPIDPKKLEDTINQKKDEIHNNCLLVHFYDCL